MLILLAFGVSPFGRRRLGIALAFIAIGFSCALGILLGGWGGLVPVETHLWGGLSRAFFLAAFGISLALPMGVALAYARRSYFPATRTLAGAWVEFWRSVPSAAVLFVAITMFPLFAPAGWDPSPLARVVMAYAFTTSAYICEAVRGALAGIPSGQIEAARAIGLSRLQTVRTVQLPQAMIIALPSLVGITIAVVKETTIVLIIGMSDFLGVVQTAILDPAWRSETVAQTGYFFAGLVFWAICFSLSRLSVMLEKAAQDAAKSADLLPNSRWNNVPVFSLRTRGRSEDARLQISFEAP